LSSTLSRPPYASQPTLNLTELAFLTSTCETYLPPRDLPFFPFRPLCPPSAVSYESSLLSFLFAQHFLRPRFMFSLFSPHSSCVLGTLTLPFSRFAVIFACSYLALNFFSLRVHLLLLSSPSTFLVNVLPSSLFMHDLFPRLCAFSYTSPPSPTPPFRWSVLPSFVL